jgi:hypothetical protein
MKTITVRANGDSWANPEQVKEQLATVHPLEPVCFDTGAEGISLEHSGILDFIDQWASATGHSQDQIVINSPNVYEKTQYQNINHADNHFLQLSGHYKTKVPDIDPTSSKFGFFVGRHTAIRDQIAVDIVKNYSKHFVMSVMKTSYAVSPWSELVRNIPSIDDLYVRDQYSGGIDTNLSLLQHYHRFQVELVAETMCSGITFFPTEKTFRPITGRRPFLIFGPVNFLNNLQQLGFKTYSECWDESYDQLEGQDRWQAIQLIINHIIHKGYDIEQAQQIANYNQQHLTQWHALTMPKNMPRIIDDS